MKPLNFKERNDKFFSFVVAGTITIGITVFCLYYTSDFLTDAIANKRVEEYSRFQQYRRNQQQYTKQLEQINKAFTDNFSGSLVASKMIADFKTSYMRNGDTTAFMSRIADLSTKNAQLVDQKNQSKSELIAIRRSLADCFKKLNKTP